MDIFGGRYYNLNRKLLALIGQWPYESKAKYLVRVCFMTTLFSLSIPHLISAVLHYQDVDRLMLNVLTFLAALIMFLKSVALTISEEKMKELYENIANNWLMIRDKKEREILIEYSERGRIITIFYSTALTVSGIIMNMLSLIPKTLDIIMPLESPREPIYISEGEFFVDRGTYFIELFFCDFILTMMVVLASLAADTIYIASTEHCCALNAIISYRLHDVGQPSLNYEPKSCDDSYNKVVEVIQLHQKAIKFTSKINDSYSLTFLFIMTANLVTIPLSGVAIIAHLHDLLAILPYLIFYIAITIHLFVMFWPGQRVLDHNTSLMEDAYRNKWYITPLRTQKILLIFMLRCSEPASVSAGGLFFMNFETFSTVMRTAVSYITVLASFR